MPHTTCTCTRTHARMHTYSTTGCLEVALPVSFWVGQGPCGAMRARCVADVPSSGPTATKQIRRLCGRAASGGFFTLSAAQWPKVFKSLRPRSGRKIQRITRTRSEQEAIPGRTRGCGGQKSDLGWGWVSWMSTSTYQHHNILQ